MHLSRFWHLGLAGLVLCLLSSGCKRRIRPPDLGRLYNRSAQGPPIDRAPVILIPGILGSKLLQEGTERVVWGAFGGGSANPNRPDGARLIALPMGAESPLAQLVDDVREGGALDSLNVRLFGLPVWIEAYVHILLALGVGGYRDKGLAAEIDYGEEHFTCFQFAYDWRRDISENAARFHEFLLRTEAEVLDVYRERFGVQRERIRFDVVAHSMGGLLLRYYLRYGDQPLGDEGSLPELSWQGSERIERAVLVAPPNAGSVRAQLELVEGTKLGLFLPRYDPALLGTMPSIYQLLPRPRHAVWEGLEGDPLDPAVWEREGWGLADPGQAHVLARLLPDASPEERRRIALDHQRKCLLRARRFFAALDRPGRPPAGTELFLVAGDAVPTAAGLGLSARGVDVSRWEAGDGTVLRSSALMDERLDGDWRPTLRSPISWAGVQFLFADHLGLTRDPTFTDNLLYLLLEDPRPEERR